MGPISRQIIERAHELCRQTGKKPSVIYLGHEVYTRFRAECEPGSVYISPQGQLEFNGWPIFLVSNDPGHLNVA